MKNIFLLFLLFLSTNLYSSEIKNDPFGNSNQSSLNNLFDDNSNQLKNPLTSQEAFSLNVDKDEQSFSILFDIKSKHYIYLEQLEIIINDVVFEDYTISNYVDKFDDYYGQTKVVYDNLFLNIKVNNVYKLEIYYQGCSEEFNLCYPKEKKVFNYPENKKILNTKLEEKSDFFENFKINKLLENNSLLFNIFIFFIGGVLVSLTPCILPMIPIISSIIINSGVMNSKKALLLSSFYVLGSAFAYSSIGIIAALSSKNIQAYMQTDFFIIATSLILILLSISMIGFFTIQSPSNFNNKINEKISKIKLDSLVNVFIVGFLSTLIISPCVAVPLAAAIIYISTTGDVLSGAVNLFSFGVGVGVILIVISTSLNKIKLKSGKIVEEVKYLISFILSLSAIFILERIISEYYTNFLYIVCLFLYLFSLNKRVATKKSLIISITIISLFYFTFLDFNTDSKKEKVNVINNLNELSLIESEKYYIKFTADWCTYCKKLDKETLADKKFISKGYKEYIVDLTEISKDENLLMKKFNVVAPPSLIFFNNNELILKEIGFVNTNNLIKKIEKK